MKKIVSFFVFSFILLCCFACDDSKKTNNDFVKKEWDDTPLRLWYDEETPQDGEGNGIANFWYDPQDYQNDYG